MHNPAYTLDGAFTATPPYARIAEAQKDEIYNPDGGPLGLQLLATGGVPRGRDHRRPARLAGHDAPGETNGAYAWTMDWDPDNQGNLPVPEMEFLASGVLRVIVGREAYLVPQFDQALSFTASDSALPVQYASTAHGEGHLLGGPGQDHHHAVDHLVHRADYDNRAANDTAMTLKIMTPNPATGDVIRAPAATDLPGCGRRPDRDPGGGGVQHHAGRPCSRPWTCCRISVNPTGWWDDVHHLNPRAARPFQDGDGNACYAYYGVGTWGTTYYIGRRPTPRPATRTSRRRRACVCRSVRTRACRRA